MSNALSTFTRYLRLYLYFMRFSFSKSAEFRFDFFFKIIMDTSFYILNFYTIRLIFLHTNDLGGFNEQQAMIYMSIYLVSDALVMTLIASNLWQLPMQINDGTLDYYLVRPVSAMFFVSFREVAMDSAVNLAMAFAIMAWSLHNWDVNVSVLGYLGLTGAVMFSFLMQWMLRMMFEIPVFWMHSGHGLLSLYFSATRFLEKPDTIYAGALRNFITYVIPLALVVSVPARLFVFGHDSYLWAQLFIVGILTFVFVGWFWCAGLRAYSSASS